MADQIVNREIDSSIAVVGGGAAGLAAALRAAELGLEVVILEKTENLGGMLHSSFGQFSAAATRRQLARGIEDSPDEHFSDVMKIGHGRNNPELARLAVDAAPGMVNWLDDSGYKFAPECPMIMFGHEPYGKPRTYWGESGNDGGLDVLRTLLAKLGASGTRVVTATKVTGLVVESGRVVGLDADAERGTTRIHCREAVLATGGYGANRQLLRRFQAEGDHALIGCLEHATGDGHEMLMNLGVEMTHCDTYTPTMGLIENPDRPGYAFRIREVRLMVNALERPPHEVWVNARGQRFVAEDTPSPDFREKALLKQPGLAMWSIWDEAALAATHEPPIGPGWTADRVRKEAQRGAWIWQAESLGALARQASLPGPSLERSIASYNRGLGRADPFGRTYRPRPIEVAPFYAVRSIGGLLLSRGGPRVDGELRPLKADGLPLTGVRAVGELLGMGQFSGDGFASGMSLGPALALGRLAIDLISGSRLV
jgi:predicted oxidoreductase